METLIKFKPMVVDPRCQDRRKQCLNELNIDEKEMPPIQDFKRKTPLSICFTDAKICLVGASWDEVKTSHPAVGRATFHGGREKIMQRPHGTLHLYANRDTGLLLGAEMVVPQGEHIPHLLAWSNQQAMTVHDLLAMPFYHPTVEEALRTALSDLLDRVEAAPSPLAGFKLL
jgi:dihydrolipoamide dehydrogenase